MSSVVIRSILACALLAASGLGVTAAQAKDFRPGDLRICNAKRCVAITDRGLASQLGPFYYYGSQPDTAARAGMGAPSFELRFRNGYVTGIVATRKLDRFLSYGVNLGRFHEDSWYRVPATIAAGLRQLTRDAGLRPQPLTRAAVRRSR